MSVEQENRMSVEQENEAIIAMMLGLRITKELTCAELDKAIRSVKFLVAAGQKLSKAVGEVASNLNRGTDAPFGMSDGEDRELRRQALEREQSSSRSQEES